MRGRILAVAAAAALSTAAPAKAGVIQDFADFHWAANGIVLGPDGNFWVVEENSDTVAQMSPAGQILSHIPVGADPQSIARGPNKTIWVSVTGADKLVWIDPASGTPHDVPTSSQSNCGPVAIADGGNNRMYFSLPNPQNGSC